MSTTTARPDRDLEPLVVAYAQHVRLWEITRDANQRHAARVVARRIHRLERKFGGAR